MYDGILFKNAKYHVYVRIQDGVEECGTYLTKIEAVNAWLDGHKTLNHTNRNPKEVHIYELTPVIEYKLKRIE